MDGRIGPGSIPAILQGRRLWPAPSSSWTAVDAPGAPDQPVWQAVGNGVLRDCQSQFAPVKPGQTLAWSIWLRALVAGTDAASFPFVALTTKRTTGVDGYPTLLYLTPMSIPAAWTYYQGTFVVPADVLSVAARPTVRETVTAGVYQVCGARLSIVGAMPVP